MNKINKAGRRFAVLVMAFVLLFSSLAEVWTVSAADTDGAEKKDSWRVDKQEVFYYSKGKKVTGLKRLNGKYYYFDKKGVQRTGWQKIGGGYYFFKIENGEKGHMVVSRKVNGISLQSSGKAKKTKQNAAKLKVMVKANKIMEKAAKPTMSRYEKLRACFEYTIKKFRYRGSPTFKKSKNWECKYAMDMFSKKRGNCYAYGAAFAFLANAAGYTDARAISSGGHGWAEVKGKVFDPSWEITDKKHHYFNMSYKLSGKDGRPNYKKNRKYVKKI